MTGPDTGTHPSLTEPKRRYDWSPGVTHAGEERAISLKTLPSNGAAEGDVWGMYVKR